MNFNSLKNTSEMKHTLYGSNRLNIAKEKNLENMCDNSTKSRGEEMKTYWCSFMSEMV